MARSGPLRSRRMVSSTPLEVRMAPSNYGKRAKNHMAFGVESDGYQGQVFVWEGPTPGISVTSFNIRAFNRDSCWQVSNALRECCRIWKGRSYHHSQTRRDIEGLLAMK